MSESKYDIIPAHDLRASFRKWDNDLYRRAEANRESWDQIRSGFMKSMLGIQMQLWQSSPIRIILMIWTKGSSSSNQGIQEIGIKAFNFEQNEIRWLKLVRILGKAYSMELL